MLEHWKLKSYTPGEGFTFGAFKERFDDSDWVETHVPGDVHTALLAAGNIEDPFYDQNEGKCAWIEDQEWWYRTALEGPEEPLPADERLRLVFEGLDTFATVYVNGEEVGGHENMFREAVFDVTGRLRPGENTLAVRLDPPLERVRGAELGVWSVNEPARTAMRKAQYGFGWDWGPRLPTVGIWRPARLVRERRCALSGVHFRTVEISPTRDRALLAVRVEAEAFASDRPLSARVRLTPPGGGEIVERELGLRNPVPSGTEALGTAYIEAEEPHLWWTHDLGEPSLYVLEVVLMEDGGELDRWDTRVGIRTVMLDQSPDPDEPGTRFFRFVLNGEPIFAKGANWIPADSFVGTLAGEAGRERYRQLIRAAAEANMNMLRVWGGGVYEHDAFYDLCDESGILVWQDFMFACSAYPENEDFAREVEAEARYQVERLRSHPSLALWCGNNECQDMHDGKFWQSGGEYQVPGSLFFEDVLPRVVAERDGATPYWPGSPYGGDGHNAREDGDRHNWEAWHGDFPRTFGEEPRRDPNPENVSYLRYGEDTGRFISEFGLHAAPTKRTLERVIPPGQLYHHSPSMDHHNKDEPKNKGDDLMLTVTGLPSDLDEYVDYSQISQAEGLKFALEHFRRRKPHCSGTLIWQFNDCWPVLSWSILDYYGYGKAGYYYTKRAFAPVLASFQDTKDGAVELWLSNDTLEEVSTEITVSLKTFAGEVLREESVRAGVPANASHAVARWDGVEGGPDRFLSARSEDGKFEANRHFFCAVKDLELGLGEPEVFIERIDGGALRVALEAKSYKYFVNLAASGTDASFSDNYFDMEAGERRVVKVEGGAGIEPGSISVACRRFDGRGA